mgnify:CR=1 FL=1
MSITRNTWHQLRTETMVELSPEEVALRLIKIRNDTRTREHQHAVMQRKMTAARIIENKRIEKNA